MRPAASNIMSPAMRAALAGLLAMATVMGVGRFVYTPILPLMIGEGALNAGDAGLVAGANYLGYLLGAIVASASVLAGRRRLWFSCGLAASLLTTAAMSLGPGFAAMAATRFLSGVASAFAMIFVTSIVMSQLAQARRPGLIALHFGGVGLGIAGSAALVTLLASAHFHWQAIWLGSALASAAAAALAWTLLPPVPEEPGKPAVPGAQARPPSVRPLATLIVSYGLFGFGYVVTATFINTMAKANPILAPIEPWVWMVVGLSGVPSVWAWNRLSSVSRPAIAYASACIAEALGVALSVLVIHPAALLLSAVLLGATFMAVTSIGLALARQMSPSNPARPIALMTAAFGFGQMLGPVIAGFLFERSGSFYLASLLAALALTLSACLAMLADRFARIAA